MPVQVRQVRGLLQEQEGLRGSRGQQAHAQAAGGRRQGQVQEGDGGTQQGKLNLESRVKSFLFIDTSRTCFLGFEGNSSKEGGRNGAEDHREGES